MPLLWIHLFGSVNVQVEEVPMPPLRTRKGYLLLALLALRGGEPIARDYLIGTLWPESDQEKGAMSLRRALHDLRAALGPAEAAVESSDKRHVRLNLDLARVDALDFLAAAARFTRYGDISAAREAVEGYRGDLLRDFDEDVAIAERHRFQMLAQTLFLRASQSALEQSLVQEAVALARRAEEIDRLHEPTQQMLYKALGAAGDPAGARRAYREFRIRLYEELHQEPSDATRQCLNALPAPQAAHAAETAATVPPDTLPFFISTFLGREKERADLIRRLKQGRLTTLTGTGGVGKTRLAIETARSVADDFPEGIYFIDLTLLPTHPPSEEEFWTVLIRSIAGEARVEEGDTRSQVVTLLRGRVLLLLDNAEHLHRFLAPLILELLSLVSTLHVLVTSRVPLEVSGEQLQQANPLPLPQSENLTAVLASDAALFFIQRVQTHQLDFALNADNASDIAQICRRLDGIPLALELAASRLRLLSPTELAHRLTDPLQTLVGSSATPDRQRTLENLIAWSYTLLSPEAQERFRSLSVFADTFSLEAAERMGERGNMLEQMATLVDSSLVQISESPAAQTRYRLLEIIRLFAKRRLEESNEESISQQHLSAWGAHFMQTAYDGLWGSEGKRWLQQIAVELPNLKQAILGGTGDTALPIAHLLEQFWWRNNRFREGREFFQLALTRPGGTKKERRACEIGSEQFKYYLGEPNTLGETLRQAIAEYQAEGEQVNAFYLIHSLGILYSKMEKHLEAENQMKKALSLGATLPVHPIFFRSYAQRGLLEVLQAAERYDEACVYGRAALRGFLELGRAAHVVQVRLQLGKALLGSNKWSEAQSELEEGLIEAQHGGMHDMEVELELTLGHSALAQGNSPEARRRYERVIHHSKQDGMKTAIDSAQKALERLTDGV